MVKKISEGEFSEVTKKGVALVDFSAVWCGPCNMVAPILEEVSNDFEGKVNFFNVDVDENPDLAVEYGITNIPALLILKDGEKQEIQVGFKPKEQLAQLVERFL